MSGKYEIGDIVYVPYLLNIPAGLYEVTSLQPLWLRDDTKGSFNCSEEGEVYTLSHVVCKYHSRLD